jgi:hypothetical protein
MASTGQALAHIPHAVQSILSLIMLSFSSNAATGQTETQPPHRTHRLMFIVQVIFIPSSGDLLFILCFNSKLNINLQVSSTTLSVYTCQLPR